MFSLLCDELWVCLLTVRKILNLFLGNAAKLGFGLFMSSEGQCEFISC
jgi:hypothetical protein